MLEVGLFTKHRPRGRRTHASHNVSDGSRAQSDRPKVVILGAGFGGLWAARHLAAAPIDVVVVDRHNYHTFFPLLYEVAAAELTPGEIAYPLRNIFRKQPNVRFCLANVDQVDLVARTVHTTEGAIAYDYLVIALGSTPAFYGVPGAAEFAFPLKDVEQALALRNHILECFEHAANDADAERRRRWLTFTILGGGPTGVEYAGALSELIRGPLTRDYPTLSGQTRIVVLEASDSLLTGQPKRLRNYARKRLEKMGVDVHLGEQVTAVSADEVRLKDGAALSTTTVVWTAGVRGEPALSAWGLPVGRGGQVDVQPTLQVSGHPEVYVVGDLAHVEHRGRPLPMVAQPAMQEGVAAARNILRQVRDATPVPFHYHDLGTLAVIGRNAAVANIFGGAFTGFFAWLLWLGVHIFNLIGFRNRLIVLIDWAWDYVFWERGVRLIVPTRIGHDAAMPGSQRRGQTGVAAAKGVESGGVSDEGVRDG